MSHRKGKHVSWHKDVPWNEHDRLLEEDRKKARDRNLRPAPQTLDISLNWVVNLAGSALKALVGRFRRR